MNRIVSKIALLSLMCIGLQVRANDHSAEIARACIAGGFYGWYLLINHSEWNAYKDRIDEQDPALIKEVKHKVDAGEQLDADTCERLSRMRMLPGTKEDAIFGYRERSEIRYLATIYNDMYVDKNQKNFAGTMLTNKLDSVYAAKMHEISRGKYMPWVYGCAAYGCASLLKMIGNQIFG